MVGEFLFECFLQNSQVLDGASRIRDLYDKKLVDRLVPIISKASAWYPLNMAKRRSGPGIVGGKDIGFLKVRDLYCSKRRTT